VRTPYPHIEAASDGYTCRKCGSKKSLHSGFSLDEKNRALIAFARAHERCRQSVASPAPVQAPEPSSPATSNREETEDEDADRASLGAPRSRCSTLDEDAAEVIREAYSRALELRDAERDPMARFQLLSGLLGKAPTYITEEALREFDISPRIQVEQALAFPSLESIRGRPVVIDFFTRAKKSRGVFVFGRAGRASKKEREAWRGEGPAPWFRMELSLPWWLASWGVNRERLRLVCHELSHCGIDVDQHGRPYPVTVTHDVEEFVWVAREFGPWPFQHQRAFVTAVEGWDRDRAAERAAKLMAEARPGPAHPSRRDAAAGGDL
jgi:hypothetical protein